MINTKKLELGGLVHISLIAVIDEKGGIGKKNQLLCHLPADLKHFKACTMGKPIIMGANTFRSIGKVLPGRKNIILSKSLSAQDTFGAIVETDLLQAIENCSPCEEVMIIGGAIVYHQSIHLATHLYLTKIHHVFEADAFFPSLDMSEWEVIHQESHDADDKNIYPYTFYKLQKV